MGNRQTSWQLTSKVPDVLPSVKRLKFNDYSTMSSSYVEVRDTENGTEDNALSFGIETCESNGIDTQAQIEGETPKDHTYNKDPVEVQGEIEVLVSEEEMEGIGADSEPVEKPKPGRRQKKSNPPKSPKKPRATRSPAKEVAKKSPVSRRRAPVKEEKPIEKSRANKKIEKETSEIPTIPDDTPSEEIPQEKPAETLGKRSRKRKIDTTDNTEIAEAKVAKKEKDTPKNKSEEKPEAKVSKKEEPKETKIVEDEKEEETKKVEEVKEKDAKVDVKSPKKEERQTNKRAAKEKAPVSSTEDVPVDDVKLPEGWSRKVVQRKSGKTAGQFDVYIYSPDGKKLRSRPDVASYLSKINSPLKAEDFSFAVKAITAATESPVAKKAKAQPKKSKPAPAPVPSPKKSPVSPKKKPTISASNKRAPRLVVKLNFTSPKKRILSNYEEQKKTEKHTDANKSDKGKKATLQKKSASGTNKKQNVDNKKKVGRSGTSKK